MESQDVLPEVLPSATGMENPLLQWCWIKRLSPRLPKASVTFFLYIHLNCSLLQVVSFPRHFFIALSSLLFISQHFHSEAYVWQTHAPAFGCQTSESLPTIKVNYTLLEKKRLGAVIILLREKKTNDLLQIDSQYSFTKDITHFLVGWHSSVHPHLF